MDILQLLGNFGLVLSSIPPAEHTFIGAGEAGRGFHAAVRLDAVEGVFVASSPSSHHRL